MPTTPSEIHGIIANLDNDSAAGNDGIKALPLKYVSNIISPILSHLINRMLETGEFPDELKVAKVTPIYKGGGQVEINNYRPISVLPVFSKVFESIINDRLTSFFRKYQTPAQYGFQKHKSTEMALIHIKEKIVENIENKLMTLGLFLDLKKAFDTVQHHILIKKLEMYGIRGVALNLMKNYLTNRYQYVSINNVSSIKMKIQYGVPQGSILGPLLFLLYINDLVEIPGCSEIIMYADDTNIFFTGKTAECIQTSANTYLTKLSKWLNTNHLRLNINKTKYMVFKPTSKRDTSPLKIMYEGNTLEQVTQQKFLGVWFSEELSWSFHVSKLKAELSQVTGSIYRIQHLIPTWLKQTYYRLSYGILIWGTTTAFNYNSLIVLQKKMLRICENYHGNRQNLRTTPLFVKYNMLKADQIYYFKLLQRIHKNCLHNVLIAKPSAYPIRKPLILPPKIRTNYGRQTVLYQATKILNRNDIKLNFNKPFATFKNECRKCLVSTGVSFCIL